MLLHEKLHGIRKVTERTSLTPPAPPSNFSGVFRTDPAALAVYSEAAGVARATPLAVSQPATAEEVCALVRWAGETSTPLIPRGSGSGMAGGAVGAGVVVDLSRLRGVGPVDVEQRLITVGPGVSRAELDDEAAESGLFFPPDPSSGAFCTVGGMTATNAAGAHTLSHGATRPWIHGLECVFDDGSRAWIRRGEPLPEGVPAIARFLALAPELADRVRDVLRLRVRKDSSGYALHAWAESGELVDLLVGSEGTLALFTSVQARLETRPLASASILAAFDSLDSCVASATEAAVFGAAACEMLDRTFLDVARQGGAHIPVPERAEAVLLIEIVGDSSDVVTDSARTLGDILRSRGASRVELALDAEAERSLWSLRHAASPILARLDPALASMQFIEDSAVPSERLPEYVRGVRQALASQGVAGVIFGHAGDAHVHVNPLVDTSSDGWRDRVERILEEVADLTIRLGGTLSGEHGDGRLRAPLLERTHGAAAMSLFALVKQAFDPAGILNPGVKIPLPGQQPLGVIKYDPSLSPHPPAAARALAHVARERDYMANRLELLERYGSVTSAPDSIHSSLPPEIGSL